MAKLIIEKPFSIEFGEETLLGTYREYTKAEKKSIKQEFDQDSLHEKELNKINKRHKELQLEMKIAENENDFALVKELYEKFKLCSKDLEEKEKTVEDLNIVERGMIRRFDICVQSDSKARIKELAEAYGYDLIFKTIYEDLEAKKKKD